MRLKIGLVLLGMAALVAGPLAPTASGEQNTPGSVLIFPFVEASSTIISISNTYLETWEGTPLSGTVLEGIIPNGNENCIGGDPLSNEVGETDVHLIYFLKSDNPDLNCQPSNFTIRLTPQDHVSFLATDIGAPAGSTGWLVAFATQPDTEDPVVPWSFDYLIGQAWVVESGDDFAFSYNAYPFLSKDWFVIPPDDMPCDREIYDDDAFLEFDSSEEYEPWPDTLLLPRFFEETPAGGDSVEKDSLIALISPLSSIEDMRNFEVTFFTLFWNNDENTHGFPFSRSRSFQCMFTGTLRDISLQFQDLEGTAEAPELDTGWAIFDGFDLKDEEDIIVTDPPLLGIFAQENTPGDPSFTGGSNFFTRGFNYAKARIQYDFGQL